MQKKIIAASLVFWMSGVLFLFCCDSTKVQAAEAESYPLAKTKHCSKQSKAETISSGSILIEPEQQMLDCCRFIPPIFDKTIKIEKIQKVEAALSTVKVLQPKFSIAKQEFSAPKNFRSIVLNRENTHLKNCVFRI